MVKNPNWYEASQLVILQMWPWIWTWDYQEQLAVRVGRKLGSSELQVQRSIHLATLPPHFDFDCGLHRSFSDISHYHQ